MTMNVMGMLPLVYCQECGLTMTIPRLPMAHETVFCSNCQSAAVLISIDGINFLAPHLLLQQLQQAQPSFEAAPPLGQDGIYEASGIDYSALPPARPRTREFGWRNEMNRRSLVMSSLLAQHEEIMRQVEAEERVQEEYEARGYSELDQNFDPLNADSMRQQDAPREYHEGPGAFQSPQAVMDVVETFKELRRRSMFPIDYQDRDYGPETMQDEGTFNIPFQNGFNPEVNFDNVQSNPYQPSYAETLDLSSLQQAISSPSMNWAELAQPKPTYDFENQHVTQQDIEEQIFATPEQAEQFRVRRLELAQNVEEAERERLWRMGSVGSLGGDGSR